MLEKIAELKVNKSKDYSGKVIKTLKEAGFVVVEENNLSFEIEYIIAKENTDE